MRYRLILLLAILSGIGFSAKSQVAAVDTIYNPNVIYTSMPRSYEIAGIKVTGADNYEDFIIIGYSGLKIGDRIEVPGEDIKMAARRFWRQALFSNVQIKVEKIAGDKVWLEFALRQQPRISSVNYVGVKKSEKEDLQERLQLMKGNQITQNIVNRATAIVKKYYADKGFKNAEVRIEQHEDISAQNEMIVDIIVDKHDKMKVNKIYIDGN